LYLHQLPPKTLCSSEPIYKAPTVTPLSLRACFTSSLTTVVSCAFQRPKES